MFLYICTEYTNIVQIVLDRLITYRSAHPDEALELSVLFKQVYIDTYGIEGVTVEFSRFIERQFSVNAILSLLAQEKTSLLLALNNGNPVGVVQLAFDGMCPLDSDRRTEVNKLYILRRFFGLGIGQGLMREAEREMRSKGRRDCWLWVLDSNKRAIDFYRQQGYRPIGNAPFQMEVNAYNNIVMVKNL